MTPMLLCYHCTVGCGLGQEYVAKWHVRFGLVSGDTLCRYSIVGIFVCL